MAYGLWILAKENVDTCCFATATPASCSRPSLGSESAGMMRHSSSSVVDLPVRPQSRVLGACLVVSGRCCCRLPRLKRPPLSCCGRQLTFAPLPENNCRVRLPWRCLVKGACIREGGKCQVPAPMPVGPTVTPHLICRCVTSRLLYVRISTTASATRLYRF